MYLSLGWLLDVSGWMWKQQAVLAPLPLQPLAGQQPVGARLSRGPSVIFSALVARNLLALFTLWSFTASFLIICVSKKV